jgi:hypothetical protein
MMALTSPGSAGGYLHSFLIRRFGLQAHRHAAQDGVAGERVAQVLIEQRATACNRKIGLGAGPAAKVLGYAGPCKSTMIFFAFMAGSIFTWSNRSRGDRP